jgi:hypothetical protein
VRQTAKIYNFWTEDEAIDLYLNITVNITFENFVEYLKDYAPHLCKKSKALWIDINK